MFRIFTYKQLSFLCVLLCLILLGGSAFNVILPNIQTMGTAGIKVPVIMYHQISDNPKILGDYAITPELLRGDFEYMKKHNINPVSFQDLFTYIKTGEKLPENPVVITFDDGERSFLTKVLPLLREYNYPANINVVGSLVALYSQNGDTDDRYAYLNEQDIKLLSTEPLVELGYHSYDMHSLSTRRGMAQLYGESDEIYINKITDDIKKFQEMFLQITGEKAIIAAYPYGIRNDTLTDVLKNEGFTVTLTCRETANTLTTGGDLYELGRFNRPYKISEQVFFESIFK